jgi:hypothetical protein
MTKTADNKLQRLPKWAQSGIRTLKANIEHLQNHVASLFTGKESTVEHEPYRHESSRLFLPDNTHIASYLDGGNVQVRIDRGRLYVMGDALGRNDLNVMPSSAADTLSIGFGERF